MPSSPPPPSAPARSFRLGRAWFLTTAANAAVGLAVFVVSPWAARVLGPERRGRLAAIQLVPMLLAELAAAGMGFAIVHYGASRPRSLRTLLAWALRVAAWGSVAMIIAGQILVAPILDRSPQDVWAMRLFLVICPLTAIYSVCSEVLRSTGDFRRWNVLTVLRGFTWPVALVAGLSGVGIPASINAVLTIYIALAGVLALGSWWIAIRATAGAIEQPPCREATFRRYGLFAAISTIPSSANTNLDQVIMSFMVGRADLGLYVAAVGWSSMTMPIMRGFTGIAMPHLSSASEENRLPRVQQIVSYSASAMVVLTIGGLAGTWALWSWRYGSAYDGAFHAALIMIPASLLLEFKAILANVLRSLNRPGLVAVVETVVLALSVAALVAALQLSTVVGPALVSLGTYAIGSLVYLVQISHLLRTPPIKLFRPALLHRFLPAWAR